MWSLFDCLFVEKNAVYFRLNGPVLDYILEKNAICKRLRGELCAASVVFADAIGLLASRLSTPGFNIMCATCANSRW